MCVSVGVCCLHISSQALKVRIINVEEYEKQENFFIVLEDPKWLKRGLSGKCARFNVGWWPMIMVMNIRW